MNILEKICASTRWKHYLLIGMLLNGTLSFFLQAMTFSITQRGLSPWMRLGFDAVAIAFSVVFFFLAFYSYRMQFDAARTCKVFWEKWLKDGAVLLVCVTALKFIPTLVWQYVGMLSPVVAMIVSAVLFVLLFLVCSLMMLVSVFDLQVETIFIDKACVLKSCCKNIKLMLATGGVFAWFAIREGIVDTLFYLVTLYTGDSFILLVMDLLIVAILDALIICVYFEYATKFRAVIYDSAVSVNEKEYIAPKKPVFAYVVLAVTCGIWIINQIWEMKNYALIGVDEYIEYLMDDAKTKLDYNRTDEFVRIYVQVEEYLHALDAYVEEDAKTLKNYYLENSEDDFYWALYFTMTNNVEAAREKLLKTQTSNVSLCHDILRYYKDSMKEELTPEDEELIEDCRYICISEGAFIDSSTKFDADSLRKKNISDLKIVYEEKLMYNDLMKAIQTRSIRGSIDEKTVYQLLNMADENPDNKAYQIMAVMGGAEYLHDNATHYNRIIECARRLNDLLEEEHADVSTLVEEKLFLAQVAINCSDYEAALEFLDNIRTIENIDVQDTILVCMERLQQYEKNIRYIDELRKEGNDRGLMDYMAAMSYLKLGEIEKALENGVRLAQKVTSDETLREENHIYLYSFAEYLCISDSFRGYIDYYYRVQSYTDEQWAIVQKAPLLENYITALNAIYNTKEKEVALSALEKIQKEAPDLSLTWYAKGTVYFNHKEYDEAMEAFKKCISIDEDNTTAVYCLAVLYDIKEDYESSAKLCEQILNIMPEVNHARDWYGVSYHTKALYEAIQKYVGGAN